MQQAIDRMCREIVDILDGRVHSVWLYGSVVLGDLQPGWSDIDMIAFSLAPLTDAQADQLLTLRQRLSTDAPGTPYYRCFEGAVMPYAAYRDDAPAKVVYWGTSGQRLAQRYALDAFARFELAHFGKAIYGVEDRSLFAVPDDQALIVAVRAHYEGIRRCAVQTDDSLYSCGWLLDIARCVYTLRHHTVIAKTAAGEWALRQGIFPEKEALERTLLIRRSPLAHRQDPQVQAWLRGLGPTVQRYADVLERELQAIETPGCRQVNGLPMKAGTGGGA